MDLTESGRVLYVSSVDLSKPTGPGVNEREFLFGLQRLLGSRSHAVIPSPATALDEIDASLVSFVPTSPLPTGPLPLFRDLAIAKRVNVVLQSSRYDLMVIRVGRAPLAIDAVSRRHGIPVAIKTLGGGFAALAKNVTLSSPKRLLARGMAVLQDYQIRRLATGAIAVDVCTDALRERAVDRLSIPADRVFLIPNSANTERFNPTDKGAARKEAGVSHLNPIVGYAGGMPRERGGSEILKVLGSLVSDFPDVGAVIVGGDADDVRSLSMEARDRGVADRVVVTGTVPYDRVPTFINCFDVGVAFDQPDRSGMVGNSYQKVRQYLACGVPTVTIEGGTIPLEAEGLGSVVPVGDVFAIERALRRWLSLDAESRRGFQETAASYAERHLSVHSALERRLAIWTAAMSTVSTP